MFIYFFKSVISSTNTYILNISLFKLFKIVLLVLRNNNNTLINLSTLLLCSNLSSNKLTHKTIQNAFIHFIYQSKSLWSEQTVPYMCVL